MLPQLFARIKSKLNADDPSRPLPSGGRVGRIGGISSLNTEPILGNIPLPLSSYSFTILLIRVVEVRKLFIETGGADSSAGNAIRRTAPTAVAGPSFKKIAICQPKSQADLPPKNDARLRGWARIPRLRMNPALESSFARKAAVPSFIAEWVRFPRCALRYYDDGTLETYMSSDLAFSGEQRKGVREVLERCPIFPGRARAALRVGFPLTSDAPN